MPDYNEKDRPRLSRAEEFKLYRVEYDDPPEPDSHQYILDLFFETGMFLMHGMGPSALTWQELESFNRTNRYALSTWESALIRSLSEQYVAALRTHQNPKSPPPYVSEDDPLGRHKRKTAKRRG